MPPGPADSFIDYLERYGAAHPPADTLRDGDDVAAWQAHFRALIEALRGLVPERAPLEVEVLDEQPDDGCRRYRLSIAVSPLAALPAWLLVPDGARPGERRPGLLALHGHHRGGMDTVTGAVDREDGGEPYALRAAQAGYVVLAPAWWGWPGRDGHLERVGGRDRCNVIQMAASMYGFTVLDLHLQDAQAALDALAARPEVDAARLGCLGNSYGGRTAMWAAIFDPRIAAVCAAGCMNTFRERSLKLSSCALQCLPGLLRHGDVPDLFGLIAPRALQLHVGAADALITPADREAIEATVRRVYRGLAAEGALDYVVHPGGHWLEWDLAAPFFARHLQARVSLPDAGETA